MAELSKLLGNSYEFTQPIEMRSNEPIAGIRSDVAVVYGDDYASMQASAADVAAILRSTLGAAGVRIGQISGQPTITATADRTAAAAQSVTPATRQMPSEDAKPERCLKGSGGSTCRASC